MNGSIAPDNTSDLFRVVTYDKENKIYVIKDYYRKNGQLQMDAHSLQTTGEELLGTVKKYRRDGSLESIAEYRSPNDYTLVNYNYFNDSICTIVMSSCLPLEGEMPAQFLFPGFLLKFRNGVATEYNLYFDNGVVANKYFIDTNRIKDPKLNIIDASSLIGEQYAYDGNLLARFTATYGGRITAGYCYKFDIDSIDYKKSFRRSNRKFVSKEKYENGKVVLRYHYDQNENIIDSLALIDSYPYSGLHIEDNKHTRYLSGKRVGTQKVYDEKGRLVALKELDDNNQFKFIQNFDTLGNQTANLSLLNGRPIDGMNIEDTYISNWKNGKEEGPQIRMYRDSKRDTMSVTQYHEGKREGLDKYFLPGETTPVAIGINKANKSFDGVFSSNGTNFQTYKQGVLTKTENRVKINGITVINCWMDNVNNVFYSRLLDTGKILICKYVDNKPFEGQVFQNNQYSEYKDGLLNGLSKKYKSSTIIEQYTYMHGLKEGPYFARHSTKNVLIKGIFQKNKPFEGDFFDSNETINNYINGESKKNKKNGRIQYFVAYEVSAAVNFVNDRKSGDATFSVVSGKRNLDSTFYHGIYKDDSPFEGTFFKTVKDEYDRNKLVKNEYKNGKKNGEETLYLQGIFDPIHITYNYKDDSLEGETVIYAADKKLKAYYSNGKIVKGYAFEEGYGEAILLTYYENGNPTDKKFVFNRDVSMIINNYEPIEGSRKTGEVIEVYKDSILIRYIELNFNRLKNDTFRITDFNNDGFESRYYNDDLYAIGKKIDDSKLSVDYFDKTGKESGSLIFMDGILYSGCAIITMPSSSRNEILLDSIKICAKNEKATIEFNSTNDGIRIEADFFNYRELNYKKLYFNLHYLLESSRQINYYESKSFKKIASYKINKGKKQGIKIIPNGRIMDVIQYKDDKVIKEINTTAAKLLKDIKEM